MASSVRDTNWIYNNNLTFAFTAVVGAVGYALTALSRESLDPLIGGAAMTFGAVGALLLRNYCVNREPRDATEARVIQIAHKAVPNTLPSSSVDVIDEKKQTLDSASSLSAADAIISPVTPPIYQEGDAIVTDGILRMSPSQCELESEFSLSKYGLSKSQLHGAQLLHGSSSASLIAFTPYCECLGDLIPEGELETMGKIPFCGEIFDGRGNVNAHYLSTSWVGQLSYILKYSRPRCWTPEIGAKQICETEAFLVQIVNETYPPDDCWTEEELNEFIDQVQKAKGTDYKIFKSYLTTLFDRKRVELGNPLAGTTFFRCVETIQVTQLRLLQWTQLTTFEQTLVADPFSVLYGIKSDRKGVYLPVRSAFPDEIGLLHGASATEIKVIFVPSEKISLVRTLLETHGFSGISIESLAVIKSTAVHKK
jgi:hypothetical protein